MRLLFFLVGVCLLAAGWFFSDTGTDNPGNDSSLLSATKAHADSFAEAWEKQDAQLLAEEYEDDAVSILNNLVLPVQGKNGLVEHFATAFSDASPMKGSTLEVETLKSTDLGGGWSYGDGTFRLISADAEVLEDGKWGNIAKGTDGRLKLVQESAHVIIKETDVLTPSEGDKALDGVAPITITDTEFLAHMDRFQKAWASNDAEALAAEFTEDADRIIGSSPDAIRGRSAILQSFNETFVEGSRFAGTSIDTTPLGFREIGENHIAAHGLWMIKNSDGVVIARGQWGNLFRRENGTVKMLMESAGAFVFKE
ncbi:MAG: DUF4440 domain-containing protein [Planctomycetia bacterium]|nr:DUF4440 domain-containing protein [Planctomycetia bacterium]NCG12441.1 DUF4440 domain-containing protein [Planctomycetia bacterium]